jgi:hypothetical protein
MNSYQMVLHRPVETARLCGKFDLLKAVVSENPYCRNFDLKRVWSLHLYQIGFPSIVTITDSPVLMLIAMGHSMERSVGS